MATEIVTIDHSGLMLPTAAEFNGYELTCPGAADRILTLAEKQFDHRAELEKIQQKSDNEFRGMGIVVGLLVIFAFVIIALILAFSGRQAEALAAIITPLIVFAIAVLKYTSQGGR